MARFHSIILSLIGLLLFRCGQVGSITGGDIDETAPRIIEEKVQPPLGSTKVYPEEIIIPFDEFIQFNKPSENIFLTPNDVQLTHEIKGKSVILNVKEGQWQPNTTYTIYFNRAIKDITESNDSIISYVFSTGSYIDSLKTAIKVVDAYTGKALEDITVGLYDQKLIDDTSKSETRYYAATNKQGIAKFQFIKDTLFYIYAFEDENLNNRLDPTEKRAFLNRPAELDTAFFTGPIIRLMNTEVEELKVKNSEILPTANWGISFNRSLKEDEKITFTDPEASVIIWNITKDSVNAYFETKQVSGNYKAVLSTAENTDTISKRFFIKDKEKLTLEMSSNLNNKLLFSADTLTLKANEAIVSVNVQSINLEGVKIGDTLLEPIDYETKTVSPIQKQIVFNKKLYEKAKLTAHPKSIVGQNYELKDTLKLEFDIQKKKETGVMIVEFDTIPAFGILVIKNSSTKKERRILFDGLEKKSERIEQIQPGEYEFHYIYDENRDGKWSTGSIFEEKEAEKIKWFTDKSTMRANWEVKTKLSIKKEKVD